MSSNSSKKKNKSSLITSQVFKLGNAQSEVTMEQAVVQVQLLQVTVELAELIAPL